MKKDNFSFIEIINLTIIKLKNYINNKLPSANEVPNDMMNDTRINLSIFQINFKKLTEKIKLLLTQLFMSVNENNFSSLENFY